MHKHELKLRHLFSLALVISLALVPISSCMGGKATSQASTPTLEQGEPEEYIADNDIAMTLMSLADALKVGEALDSTEYDYEGVLTDGEGAPLYTDVQGSPGVWAVDVLDAQNVMIRNIYLGDLLPFDLESYILGSLNVPFTARMDVLEHEALEDDETDVSVYDCDGVYLRFEVRSAIAPNGLEGPLLSIIMSREAPAWAEKRTSV